MLGLTSTVQAQSFAPFFEDFEDGSATDGNPVRWADYPAPYNLIITHFLQNFFLRPKCDSCLADKH
jgi:hypothetical protein